MPLGWWVSVHQGPVPPEGAGPPAPGRSPVARWFAGLAAGDWLPRLIRERAGRFLGGDDYPSWYAVRVRDLLPHAGDAAPEVAARCGDDEWVVLEVWDAS